MCDVGSSCNPGVEQGSGYAYASWNYDTATYQATAIAAAVQPERWIFTTCGTVSLTAYEKGSSAAAAMTGCELLCAASATYEVYASNEMESNGAFCSTSSDCQDDTIGDGHIGATKYSISVSIPNTMVVTKTCAYAAVYFDYDQDGQWSDNNPVMQDSQCAPTNNYIGLAPL